jgi:FG-GAP-like repeat
MFFQPAFVDTLRNFAADRSSRFARKSFPLLAVSLVWFAAAQAQAQPAVLTITATPNYDAVTGVTLTSPGSVTITDGNGTLIALGSTGAGPFVQFEQPNNNTTWTAAGASPSVITPSTFAPQCAPPSLTVSSGNFNARIMKGGLGAPPSGAFTVSNAGGSAIYLAATPNFPSGAPFFTVGTVPALGPNATSALTVSPNSQAFSLPPGRYTASIDFSNAANLSLVTTRQLQLTVVPSLAHDYNGNGYGDIAWRDDTAGLAIWLTQGTSVTGSGSLGPVAASTTVVGQRDFDGDTRTDLLMRDTNGDTSIWFLNGTQQTSTSILGNIPSNWTVITTGDFDGDGKGDILWRDTDGNVAMWLMNGGSIATSVGVANVPTIWSIIGTGDFNGDGTTDLLWQDNLGNTAIWLMNGPHVVSSTGLGTIAAMWQVAGTGDFDGDGNTDLLWRDTTSGNTAIWLMNGASVTTSASLGIIPLNFSVAEIGDYNGDGYSDVLWRDGSGDTAFWFMKGVTIAQSVVLGNIPINWTVQSQSAE